MDAHKLRSFGSTNSHDNDDAENNHENINDIIMNIIQNDDYSFLWRFENIIKKLDSLIGINMVLLATFFPTLILVTLKITQTFQIITDIWFFWFSVWLVTSFGFLKGVDLHYRRSGESIRLFKIEEGDRTMFLIAVLVIASIEFTVWAGYQGFNVSIIGGTIDLIAIIFLTSGLFLLVHIGANDSIPILELLQNYKHNMSANERQAEIFDLSKLSVGLCITNTICCAILLISISSIPTSVRLLLCPIFGIFYGIIYAFCKTRYFAIFFNILTALECPLMVLLACVLILPNSFLNCVFKILSIKSKGT